MAEHPLSKREVVGSNPTGGFCSAHHCVIVRCREWARQCEFVNCWSYLSRVSLRSVFLRRLAFLGVVAARAARSGPDQGGQCPPRALQSGGRGRTSPPLWAASLHNRRPQQGSNRETTGTRQGCRLECEAVNLKVGLIVFLAHHAGLCTHPSKKLGLLFQCLFSLVGRAPA